MHDWKGRFVKGRVCRPWIVELQSNFNLEAYFPFHLVDTYTYSISTGAQYVTLDNKIKCLSLAFLFGNPTNKTVTGTGYICGDY
jgi:hypothetical protein